MSKGPLIFVCAAISSSAQVRDAGRAPADLPMARIILHLRQSDAQQAARTPVIGTTRMVSTQFLSYNPSQIQVSLIVGLSARNFPVQVVNTNGQTSNTVTLQNQCAGNAIHHLSHSFYQYPTP